MWTGYAPPTSKAVQLTHAYPRLAWNRPVPVEMQPQAYNRHLYSSPARFSQAARLDSYYHQASRNMVANRLAVEFCAATLEKIGTDEHALKTLLKKVHRMRLQPEFQKAVRNEARRHGVIIKNASEVIDREFGGNIIERIFKSAPRKELQDYLTKGYNAFSPKPWEYRLNGMYRSLADFFTVCKKYPVMSAGVIGSVAWLGHRYPFLGAVSGAAIMAWSSVFSVANEVSAYRIPKMNARKAEHYRNSGENISAFLITGLGMKGIQEGTLNGFRQGGKAYHQVFGMLPKNQVVKNQIFPMEIKAGLRGTFEAIRSELPHDRKMTPIEAFLFVSGLFDNVLLPFNWLADKMKQK